MRKEGIRKLRVNAAFQLTKGSGGWTLYMKNSEDYSTVSGVDSTDDVKLIHIIK